MGKKKDKKAGKDIDTAAIVAEVEEQIVTLGIPQITKSPRTPNRPFKRVDESRANQWKQQFSDNSFDSKIGDEYGRKASEVLVRVRGKDFRHEKTKRKRAYSGGPITHNVNSFQFEDSD